MLWFMTKTKQRDGIPTERRKRYPFARLEPRTFCLPSRRTKKGYLTLRFTDVTQGYKVFYRTNSSDLNVSIRNRNSTADILRCFQKHGKRFWIRSNHLQMFPVSIVMILLLNLLYITHTNITNSCLFLTTVRWNDNMTTDYVAEISALQYKRKLI
jgi:hypothetical protein